MPPGAVWVVRLWLGVLGGSLAVGGCRSHLPPLDVSRVVPGAAYNDDVVPLQITTSGLRVSLDIDLGQGALSTPLRATFLLSAEGVPGAPSVPLTQATWVGDALFSAEAPSGLPAGTYALVVTDEDGRRSPMGPAASYTSLGPDQTPPSLQLVAPLAGSVLRAGSSVLAEAVAYDGAGTVAAVTWTTSLAGVAVGAAQPFEAPPLPSPSPSPAPGSALPATPDASDGSAPGPAPAPAAAPAPALAPAPWTASIPVPSPPDDATSAPFDLDLVATDTAGNQTPVTVSFTAARAPTIVAFAPTEGALAGGEPFSLSARDLLPGAVVRIGGVALLAPAVGDPVDGTSVITGLVPMHGRAELAAVSVETAAGSTTAVGGYAYLAPPLIRDIEPGSGPVEGGLQVTIVGSDLGASVRLFVGSGPDDAHALTILETFDPPNKIVACLPPGAGTVEVWAEDPVAGNSAPDAVRFTYLPDGAPLSAVPGAACTP